MTCQAPERELLSFLAAGRLAGPEQEAVRRHADGCGECGPALADARSMVAAMEELHLTSEEAVAAAWGEARPDHLDDCPRCRSEVELLRGINADLERPALPTRPRLFARPALAWAAALVMALPAALYLRERLRPAPVTFRDAGVKPAALAVDHRVALASGAAVEVPRGVVLLSFEAPPLGPGDRLQVELKTPSGATVLEARKVVADGGRVHLVIDTSDLPSGTWRLVAERLDVTETHRERLVFELRLR